MERERKTIGDSDIERFPGVHGSMMSFDGHDNVIFTDNDFKIPERYNTAGNDRFVPRGQWGEYKVLLANGGATPRAFRTLDLFTPNLTDEEVAESWFLEHGERPKVISLQEYLIHK